MAEFGADITEAGPTPNHVTPQAPPPVRGNPFESATQAIRSYRRGAVARRVNKDDAFVGRLTKKWIDLQSAVDQGMDPKAARARATTILTEGIDTHPHLSGQIMQSFNGIFTGSGIGKDVYIDREKELFEAQRTQAVEIGLLHPNETDPEKVQQAVLDLQIRSASMANYEAEMKRIDYELAQGNLTATRRQELEEGRKNATLDLLTKNSPLAFANLKNQFEKVLNDPEIVGGAAKKQAIDMLWLAELNKIAPLEAVIGNETQAKALRAAAEGLVELYGKMAMGDLTREQMDNQVAIAENTSRLLLLQDPYIAGIIAAANYNIFLGEHSQKVAAEISKRLYDILESQGSVLDQISKPGAEPDMQSLQEALNIALQPPNASTPEEAKEVQRDTYQKLMESIMRGDGFLGSASGDKSSGPERLIPVVEMYASDRFFEVSSENPDIRANFEEGTKKQLETYFNKQAYKLIQETLGDKKVYVRQPGQSVGRMEQLGQNVEVEWRGGLAQFKFAEGSNFKNEVELDMLNERLAPILTTLVKANAHLEGHQNYQQVFDQSIDSMLGTTQVKPKEEGTSIQGPEQIKPVSLTPPSTDAEYDRDLQTWLEPVENNEEADVQSDLRIPAEAAQDTGFINAVSALADDVNTEADNILGVIGFETGGSFDPAQKNLGGSSATGLIQFLTATAESLGTTVEDLAKMSREEQMQYVSTYMKAKLRKVDEPTLTDVYMAVLWPEAVGKGDDYILQFNNEQYDANKGLDTNSDGSITAGEATQKVKDWMEKNRLPVERGGQITDREGNANPQNFLATNSSTQNKIRKLSATLGKPLQVTPHGGKQLDGRKRTSQHHHGNAVDVWIGDMSYAERVEFVATAIEQGAKGIGGYAAGDGKNTIHIDYRKKKGKQMDGMALWWRKVPGKDGNWQAGEDWFVEGIKLGRKRRDG